MTVICLGEILIDRLVALTGDHEDLPGGAPANVAVALARLGLATAFIGAVGEDEPGQQLTHLLSQAGVNCDGLQRRPAPTRIVEVQCSPQGDRTFGGFIGGETTEFADAHLIAADLPASLLTAAPAVVAGTLGLAYPTTRKAMLQAAARVKAQGGKLVIDVNWRPTFWPDSSVESPGVLDQMRLWLAQADVIKMSLDEAIALFDTDQIQVLTAQFPQAQILLTDGDQGCQYGVPNIGYGHVPAFVVTAVETTGAGDAFLAGMVYQWTQCRWQFADRQDLEQAITFAQAMGALTTLKPGAIAAQPHPHELLDFLRAQTGRAWTLGTV